MECSVIVAKFFYGGKSAASSWFKKNCQTHKLRVSFVLYHETISKLILLKHEVHSAL